MTEEKSTEEVKEPNQAPASYSRDVMKVVLNLIIFHIKYNFFANLNEKGAMYPEDIKSMQEIVEKAARKVADEIDESEDVTNNYFGRTGINKEKLPGAVHDVQLALNRELDCIRGNAEYHIIEIGEWWNLMGLVTPRYDKYDTLADKICEILELLLFNDAYVKKCDAMRKLQQYRELWQLVAPPNAKDLAGIFDREFVLPSVGLTNSDGYSKDKLLSPGIAASDNVYRPHHNQQPSTGFTMEPLEH